MLYVGVLSPSCSLLLLHLRFSCGCCSSCVIVNDDKEHSVRFGYLEGTTKNLAEENGRVSRLPLHQSLAHSLRRTRGQRSYVHRLPALVEPLSRKIRIYSAPR